MTARGFARWWLPVLAWAALISFFSTGYFTSANTGAMLEPFLRFFWSGMPPEVFEWIHFLIRKSAHVTEYMILSLLLFRALRAGRDERRTSWVCLSLGIAGAYAGLDEFHQSFVPGRTASVVDVGIDFSGGALGQALLWFRRR